jgi:hypothetical protein
MKSAEERSHGEGLSLGNALSDRPRSMSSWIKSSLPGEQNAASLGNHLFIYCAIHFSPNIGCEYGKDLVCKAERVPDPGRKAVFIRYFCGRITHLNSTEYTPRGAWRKTGVLTVKRCLRSMVGVERMSTIIECQEMNDVGVSIFRLRISRPSWNGVHVDDC